MGHIFEAMQRAGRGEAPTTRPQDALASEPRNDAADTGTLPFTAIAAQAEADDESISPELEALPEAAPLDQLNLSSAEPLDQLHPSAAAGTPISSARCCITDLTQVDDRLVGLCDPSSVMAEEYRSIRTSILARWKNQRRLVHTITSATPQEGKTITSLNLGLSFSELRNRRTIVVEADLRLPQFQKLMTLPDTPGLVGVLRGDASLESATLSVGETQLHVLAAGESLGTEAVQLLSCPTMVSLLQTLRQRYDHIIIDTPPVVELADAGILGALSDDVLLIARMRVTPRGLIDQAIRTLTSYNAAVGGLIATDQPPHHGKYSKYAYRYRYRYHAKKKAA